MTNYSRSVLKSNGYSHPENRLKKFEFSLKSLLQISSKSYRHNAVPNRFSSHLSTSRTNGPRLLSRVKAGTHSPSPTESHTRAHTAKQGASLLRTQGDFAPPEKSPPITTFATLDSAVLLYTYISRFSVNPNYQQREKIRQSYSHKFYPPTAFHRVFQLLAQTPHVRFHA